MTNDTCRQSSIKETTRVVKLEEKGGLAIEDLTRADALTFGQVTYEMMEAGWRPPARTGARLDWMESFARTLDAAKNLQKPRVRKRKRRQRELKPSPPKLRL